MRNWLPLKTPTLLALCMVLPLSFSTRDTVDDWRSGELVVILPPIDSLDQQFNRQLAKLFAVHLGVRLRTIELYPYQVQEALSNRVAHLSAIGMRSNEHDSAYKFGVPYQEVSEIIVCGNNQPAKQDELSGRNIIVIKDSAQDAAMHAAYATNNKLKWTTVQKSTPGDLLRDVNLGDIDCTVANEEQIAFMRNLYPGMDAEFEIATPSELAWTFATDVDAELYAKMEQFFAQIEEDGTLSRLMDRFYGHNERIIPFDAAAFLTKISAVLPHYRQLFEEAGSLTGIEWQLLAAIAYRESHWNPLATSYTNVRGMMMLTEDTADRMNVSNRLDPRESIMAGARYLQMLKEQLPLRIDEPERTWLALAAYNKGMGHLEDARTLAQRYGMNPDQWLDVQKAMVKLRNPNIAQTLKHGYARGGEAVIFVETVRLYSDILKRISRDENKQILPADYQTRLHAW